MTSSLPKWTNSLPIQIAIIATVLLFSVVLGVTYYFTPKYTRVGYAPTQPVPFSHELHAGQLGIDCRYCHTHVEQSGHSNVPDTATCMNCHNAVAVDSPKLQLVRESYESGEPIPWVRIHALPDYVYFNHAVHVNRGISCYECHGQINQMEVVRHDQPLSMSWCLDCHRAPEEHLRPLDEIYNMDWRPESRQAQLTMGLEFKQEWDVNPPLSCSGCHR